MDFNTIKFEKKLIESWNNTLSSKAYILYPKNILELKKLISIIKKDKKYLIRTGSCSYDSKSINPDLETIVISLKYFDKITKLDFKNKFIEVEAGALIEKIIKEIKKNHLTLFLSQVVIRFQLEARYQQILLERLYSRYFIVWGCFDIFGNSIQ